MLRLELNSRYQRHKFVEVIPSEDYGLTQVPIAGLSPDAEPDPGAIADIADVVRREGATTIFTESLAPPNVAEALARETGARVAVLDPVEGLTQEQIASGDDYVTVMERNLDTLRAALGCR